MEIMENELYHFGIKGQKWGIRRFQNKNGSYTDEGKKRYGIDPQSNATNKSIPFTEYVEKFVRRND